MIRVGASWYETCCSWSTFICCFVEFTGQTDDILGNCVKGVVSNKVCCTSGHMTDLQLPEVTNSGKYILIRNFQVFSLLHIQDTMLNKMHFSCKLDSLVVIYKLNVKFFLF